MRCGVEVAPLRAEPRDDAEQVTQALRGEPLEVEERRDGWARVRTAYDYPAGCESSRRSSARRRTSTPSTLARTFLGAPLRVGRA